VSSVFVPDLGVWAASALGLMTRFHDHVRVTLAQRLQCEQVLMTAFPVPQVRAWLDAVVPIPARVGGVGSQKYRTCRCASFRPLLEEGCEGVFGPDAFEDELEHVPFGFRVGLVAPEEGEVVEDLLGLVKVGKRLGSEVGELGLNLLATGEVFAAVDVAEFVQVAKGRMRSSSAARFRTICFVSGPLPAARR
jgi:hypothetical protein